MDSRYEMISTAAKKVESHVSRVKMTLATLDPDAPYRLHWDITLDIPALYRERASDYVFDFLINFNEYLLEVTIGEQK